MECHAPHVGGRSSMWVFFQLVCGCIIYKQLASLQHNRMTTLQCPDHSEGCRQLSEAPPGQRAAMTSASTFLAVPSTCHPICTSDVGRLAMHSVCCGISASCAALFLSHTLKLQLLLASSSSAAKRRLWQHWATAF